MPRVAVVLTTGCLALSLCSDSSLDGPSRKMCFPRPQFFRQRPCLQQTSTLCCVLAINTTALFTENQSPLQSPSFLCQWQQHPEQPLLGYLNTALLFPSQPTFTHGPSGTNKLGSLCRQVLCLSKSTCQSRLYKEPAHLP